jgi:hypothetical protein
MRCTVAIAGILKSSLCGGVALLKQLNRRVNSKFSLNVVLYHSVRRD